MLMTRDNPVVNAQVRLLLWEVPINFPGSRTDWNGDTTPQIKAWMDKRIESSWSNPEHRSQIMALVLEQLFPPEYEN